MNRFVKSHGLGNEYIVLDQEGINFELSEKAITLICNVNFGIGSDGILLKVNSETADFGLRIFNPDGSEAEKSGNGLRIFCKYLYDYGFTSDKRFSVETKGGIVQAEILGVLNNRARMIKVDMGKAIFQSKEIPTLFESEESMSKSLMAKNKEFAINCVSVGNPHCVIIQDELSEEEIKKYGKFIENHQMFPNRINVQFVKILNRKEVEVLIWERGAEYTLASGSSSCAVVSVLRKKGLVDNEVTVFMPGGQLKIEVDEGYNIKMTGEVREIASGGLSQELLEEFE